MTRSRTSGFHGISFPRILNVLVVLLVLGFLYTRSLPQNTAQEPAPAAASQAESTAEAAPDAGMPQPAETSAPESADKPADPPAGESAPESAAPSGTGPVFPVPEGDREEVSPFAVPDTAESRAQAEELAAQLKTAPKESASLRDNVYFIWAVFLLIVAGSFAAGNHLAKYWRLPDHNIRIFVLFLAFFGSIAAVVLGWHRLTLGIDLKGGVVLVYDAKPIQRGAEDGGSDAATSSGDGTLNMDQLARAITKRINPGGVREISITKLGSQQIQVIIPNAEEAEVARIERVISESGALTFRILASRLYPQDAAIITQALGRDQQGRDVRDAAGKLLARWVPVFESEKEQFLNNPDIVTRDRRGHLEVLILFNDGVNVIGKDLSFVGHGNDNSGNPGVSFEFNAVGENKFRRLTSANRPDPAQARLKRQLGIVLNDSLYSAPSINDVIGKSGIITFGRRHTEEEQRQLRKDIDDLISILDAGALPAELSKEPVSRLLIGATLGTDTIRKGSVSLVAAAIVVLLFMLFYYRLAGLIACFCVVTNLFMLIAIMLALRAAFTLPGLAGLVLTIGMAVDANILIYERLREELAAGSSLKMAIRNAYAKALSAIVDSNITTIITGIILYMVGTEQVKGFAVTLVLGVSLSMFTAIYCARTIMDIFEAQKSIRTFRMMQLFKRPNINFLGARNYCLAFSIALTVVGLAAVYARGTTIFDIDFVGGVSVEAVFHETQDVTKLRNALYAKDETIDDVAERLNDLSVQEILEEGRNTGTRFIVTTSIPQVPDRDAISPEQYLGTVRNIIKETFGEALVYNKLDFETGESTRVGDHDETAVTLTMFPSMNREAFQSAVGAAIEKAKNAGIVENDFGFTITREGSSEEDLRSHEDWSMTVHASKETIEKVLRPMKAELDGTPYFPTSTTVGGSVARDTRIAGLLAVLGSLICIILYIWFRFQRLVYGVAAVVGLIHDVLVVLGMIALSAWLANPLAFLQVNEFKIGLPVVAAFLTIIGYSLNDTIILFDRIRENRGKSPALTDTMINNSINQTLSRTVLTSLTTFLVAIILYFWGGQGIHTFAFAMSVGVAFGTYSTIGLCAPVLYWMIGVEDPAKKKDTAAGMGG